VWEIENADEARVGCMKELIHCTSLEILQNVGFQDKKRNKQERKVMLNVSQAIAEFPTSRQ
jgi:hypothetical protein